MNLDAIQQRRKDIWSRYYEALRPMAEAGFFSLPLVPDYATNNAHMFYLLFPDLAKRTDFIAKMKERDIWCVFHYLALHDSEFYRGKHDGRPLPNCDHYADCLVRLPLYYELDPDLVLTAIQSFFVSRV